MIADPWMPPRRAREPKTDEDRRATTSDRRERLRAANKCINGPLEGNVGHRGVVHGPVVARGRCQRCLDVNGRAQGAQS